MGSWPPSEPSCPPSSAGWPACQITNRVVEPREPKGSGRKNNTVGVTLFAVHDARRFLFRVMPYPYRGYISLPLAAVLMGGGRGRAPPPRPKVFGGLWITVPHWWTKLDGYSIM